MRRAVFPILMGLVGCAVLIWLGVWQMQRLAWKEAMLHRIESRIGGAPVALPAAPDPEADEYLPVTVTGTLDPKAVHVLSGVTGQSPNYRLIQPLTLEDRRIMVDLGTIPEAARSAPPASGAISVQGNLHWPDETTSWTPAPDLAKNLWYAREVDQLATHLGTDPILVVAQAVTPDLGSTPVPVSTRGIPNDHLGYAITWFGLALVWAVMSLLLIRRTLRSRP